MFLEFKKNGLENKTQEGERGNNGLKLFLEKKIHGGGGHSLDLPVGSYRYYMF